MASRGGNVKSVGRGLRGQSQCLEEPASEPHGSYRRIQQRQTDEKGGAARRGLRVTGGPDDKVELLGGQLMVAEPQGSRHAATVSLVADALRTAFGSGWYVMTQLPVALDHESEPEPDVAVVAGTAREYWDAHPLGPVLVVEVADSSVALDREHKLSLCARAGVPEYWIVNIGDGMLKVYRRPVPSPEALFGWRYAEVQRLGRSATVFPVAVPSAPIAVADLLR